MKNAILISGSAGSGKTLLARKIKKRFARSGAMDPDRPDTRWLAPGTEAVVVEEVTSITQLEKFLGYITDQPIPINSKREGAFSISPFFIFVSQKVRLLPENFTNHFAHVDCYYGGAILVNLNGLPEKVTLAVHGYTENVRNFRCSDAAGAL